jgi:hyperosmotically inducible protein
MIEVSMATTKRPMTGMSAPLGVLLLSFSLLPAAFAQTQAAPDNSANNRVQNKSKTADQQKNNTSDRELTAKIRRAVVADKSLSTYGHNVKIIVLGGAVTLKGPVHTEAEKQTIATKAADVVGQDKVTNQLTVKQ